jgi:hypothetical protein
MKRQIFSAYDSSGATSRNSYKNSHLGNNFWIEGAGQKLFSALQPKVLQLFAVANYT